jgi:hypothetical protein
MSEVADTQNLGRIGALSNGNTGIAGNHLDFALAIFVRRRLRGCLLFPW